MGAVMGGTIRVGRVFGIPLEISYTWFPIFAFVTYALASWFGSVYPHWSPAEQWGVALVTSLLLFASVLAHEISHSLVAIRLGIPVRRITLFIFGGVAQIAHEANSPRVEATVALVGPLSSLAIGGISFGLYLVLQPVSEHLAAIAVRLFLANMVLGIFNMLPGFPLDGGRVFRATIWALSGSYVKATRVASGGGQVIAMGLVITGIALSLFQRDLSALWLVFIGLFLQQAAVGTYRQLKMREGLRGYRVRYFMGPPCPLVDGSVTLDRLEGWHPQAPPHQCLAVAEQGLFQGLITPSALNRVPHHQWPFTAVREVMTPVHSLKMVDPDEEVLDVLEDVDERDLQQIPVLEDGVLLGLITRERLLQGIRLRIKTRD